jgi:protein SCO1/2
LVLGKSKQTGELTVEHEAIPGFMPAMIMTYKVTIPATLDEVQPGDEISADVLATSNDAAFTLDRVKVTGQSREALHAGTLPAHRLLIGETVPDIPLVNQDGTTLHLQELRGKALLVTFIYTRCPMPTACPRISSRFAQVNKELSRDPLAYRDSHLLSVSLDPAYDTPSILRNYGLAYLDNNRTGFSHWEFATTQPDYLKRLALALGLEYTVEGGQIVHSMQTILVGRNGDVIKSWSGSDWDTNEVVASVARVAKETQ